MVLSLKTTSAYICFYFYLSFFLFRMKEYTISVFTENKAGLLQRVVQVFTRRHINIESLTTSQSSMPGIFRFTILVNLDESTVRKVTDQLDKQVDVIKAFYYDNKDVVHQEIALYKVPTEAFANNDKIEKLIRKYNARILTIEPEYTVIEKTGHQEDTEKLLGELKKIGIYEFVRSGRIAITKPMEQLNAYLKAMEMEAN
jgi:acetolactate synthase I/III small subunit